LEALVIARKILDQIHEAFAKSSFRTQAPGRTWLDITPEFNLRLLRQWRQHEGSIYLALFKGDGSTDYVFEMDTAFIVESKAGISWSLNLPTNPQTLAAIRKVLGHPEIRAKTYRDAVLRVKESRKQPRVAGLTGFSLAQEDSFEDTIGTLLEVFSAVARAHGSDLPKPAKAESIEPRAFRSRESCAAESTTRSLVIPFLTAHSFSNLKDERKSFGQTERQTISGRSPAGSPVTARVKLCWRRDGRNAREDTYSATQLIAKTKSNDAAAELLDKFAREAIAGVTHLLVVQGEENGIGRSALVPVEAVPRIWRAQLETSARMIAAGQAGRRKKNHAANGHSPTLWLQDDQCPAIADLLWRWPGVIDLGPLRLTSESPRDDTFDDLAAIDDGLLGADSPEKLEVTRSSVKRDPKVRHAVLRRAHGKCEQETCGAFRDFAGFLDVHHVLGIEKSDRVHNCVALCPNCHREAHFSPNRDEINAVLLVLAERKSKSRPSQARA
jgi:5-methylcytosine-specific restriction protein A